MTLLNRDTANRANESPLASPWVESNAGATMRLVSNMFAATTGGANCIYRDTAVTYPTEHEVEVTIGAVDTGNAFDAGPAVSVTAGGNAYVVTAYNGTTAELYRVASGGFGSQVASGACVPAVGGVLRLRRATSGANAVITCWYNGTQIFQYTDTSPLAAGAGGMFIYGGVERFDEYAGFDLTAGTPVGQASETNTAQPITQGGPVPVGQAAERNEALPIDGVDLAQAEDLFTFGDDTGNESSMGGLKLLGGFPAAGATVTVNPASETNLAQPIAARLVQTLAQAAESNLAQPIAARLVLPVGPAAESDTAQPLGARLVQALAPAAEADAAQPITTPGAAVVGQAAESNLAQPVGAVLRASLGQAAESNTAQAFTARLLRTLGQAAEADIAQPVAARLVQGVGQAAESNTAQAFTVGGGAGTLGVALELNAALSVQAMLRTAIAQAAEANAALAMVPQYLRLVGPAAESDAALVVLAAQLRQVGIASTLEQALAFGTPGVQPTWPAGGPVRIGSASLSSSGARIGAASLKAINRRIG